MMSKTAKADDERKARKAAERKAREEKAREILNELDTLSKKYGFETFRAIANRYLKLRRLQARNRAEVARLEKELEGLRAKL